VTKRYLIALGSNVRHHRHGLPPMVLRAALAELERDGLAVERTSPVISTAPLGPSLRRYANAAAIVVADMMPDTLLRRLKSIERDFGRRNGRRWAARVLDLDIVLWEGGTWASRGLTVPHVAFRDRRFVLEPAAAIAPRWRDPLTGRTLRQLAGLGVRPRKS
jgi:2-amino-4-hydroxy-6-hydroxymethyldihydropteridine diphosphokinase